jgi:hypothetical protein
LSVSRLYSADDRMISEYGEVGKMKIRKKKVSFNYSNDISNDRSFNSDVNVIVITVYFWCSTMPSQC